VVGVLADAAFGVETVQLSAGDALILYSDGLEKMLVPQMSAQALAEAFQRAADVIAAWRNVGLHDSGAPASPAHRAGAWAERTAVAPVAVAEAEPAPSPLRLARGDEPPAWTGSGLPPDEMLTGSTWFGALRDEGLAPAFDQLNLRFDVLQRIGHPLDDLTVVAVQVDAPAEPPIASA